LLWELNSKLGFYKLINPDLSSSFFPSLGSILESLIHQIQEDQYIADFSISLSRVIISFGLATVLGVLTGLISARIKLFNDANFLFFEFLRQLPAVAIIPLSIMFFGFGSELKIFISFFGCFFPIYLTTIQSLQNIDSILLKTAKNYKWSGNKLIFGVMLPSAIPSIIAILRVTLSISLILVITTEMIAGGEGLGARLVMKERSFDFPGLYADTFALGIVGLLLNYSFQWISLKILFWKSKSDWSK
jgi:ABC-type nitrate/sulfonate/bicarbonate transport system permease component